MESMAGKNRKNGYTPFITLIILLVMATVTIIGYLYLLPKPQQKVKVQIKTGSSSDQIATILADQGVVNNALLFKLYIGRRNAQDKLQAGEYELMTRMSYADALAKLLKGPFIKYYTVVIPEGFTVDQTADKIAKESPIKKQDFLDAAVRSKYDFPFLKNISDDSLEGYLFPKTYTVTDKTTAEDLVTLMLRQFNKEVMSLDMSFATKRNLSLNQILTVASIIEKEVKKPNERALVSAVIYNRLDRGMLLQIDATVEYALPEHKESLSYADLEVDSPYNTYKNPGLPPGPICSPGLASVEAALAPAPVNYLYYVLTGEDGSHTFTATYEEFSKIKAEKGL